MATLAERAAAAQARLAPKTSEQESASGEKKPVKLSKAWQALADYEGAIESVEVDGLAVLKMLQHASGLSSTSTGSGSGSVGTTTNVAAAGSASGYLFGLALGPKLSIANTFPLPSNHLLPSTITTLSNINLSSASAASNDEKAKVAKVASEREKEIDNAYRNAKNFVGQYLPRAKEVNLDSEIVGGYFVTKDGMDLLKEGVLVDILIRYQFGIGAGHGGAAAAASAQQQAATAAASSGDKKAGASTTKFKASAKLNKRGVAIVYGQSKQWFLPWLCTKLLIMFLLHTDASSSSNSSLAIKAYSLSPSFLKLYETSSSFTSHKFDYASLAAAGLTPSTLLVSYPVTITSSSLLTAFLAANPEAQSLAVAEEQKSYSTLSADDSLENNLRSLIGAMDSANASVQSLGYQGRAARFAGQGQSTANVDNLNRLDSIRTMAVAEGAAKNLGQQAGLETVRAWAAKSSVA